MLYDLAKDPYEWTNLVGDAASAGIRGELEGRLEKWMKDTGDSWRFDSEVPVEDKGRLYRFATFYTIDEYVGWAREHPNLAPED